MSRPDTVAPPGPLPRRADVQGLRAVAVVLVVAFHAGLPVPGGFVGVDVFFVISGLVIGRLLLAEVDATGSVRVGHFLARRVRRLLPLLALVVAVTLVGVILLTNPYPVEPVTARTGAAGLVSLANVYLYRHTGYFDLRADEANPLLHLWSLSVEEQFYLALPVGLLLLAAAGRRWPAARRQVLAAGIALATLASFALSWALASGWGGGVVEAPERLGFYASPARAWEMGLGLLLACAGSAPERLPGRWAVLLGALGAALLAAAALLTDPLAPFPGPAALPATGAAVLLLVAGAASGGPVARALGVRPLRWVGDRSYGWYLWHWPAIVLVDQVWPGHPWALVAAAFGALGLAAVTRPLVEERFRVGRGAVPRRGTAALVAVCLVVPGVLVVAVGSGTRHGWGLEEPLAWYETPEGRNVGCVIFNRDLPDRWPEEACTTTVPDPEGRVLVAGDAFADSVTPGVVEAASGLDLEVAEWARAGCPLGLEAPEGYPRCASWQQEVLAAVDRLDVDVVVVANRPPDQGGDEGLASVGVGAGTMSTQRWADGLDGLLTALGRRGVGAVVVAPAPDFGRDHPRDRLSLVRPDPSVPVLTRAEVAEQRGAALDAEREVVAVHPGAVLVDPVEVLCEADCRPTAPGGGWLYYDGDSLTLDGSARLAGPVGDALRRLRGTG
ncbi:acyltransferase family protein [Iamia majanohamensis]|uniref:Acyltransferase family protein n=1 Tax=Iamia majanohamensis TaxID=467976 RepID=A0AAF0BUB3_9ACTN|nr:acyltransferase family protein [Iamia majanohamensis]WCO65903.1 acyltransferase family protein [Iamia majanohamensis]